MHIEKTIRNVNETIVCGKVNEKNVIVKIQHPKIDNSTVEMIKNSVHVSNLENDVYRTASLECQLECNISVLYPESSEKLSINKQEYEYCIESYKEYLNSSIKESVSPTPVNCLYEDESIRIFSSEIAWHCLFKDEHIHSIRELSNLETLYALKEKIQFLLKQNNRSLEDTCLHFDYQGKLPCLLLNIVDISNGLSNLKATGKFIYFDTLIKNLETAPEYYRSEIHFIKAKDVHVNDEL